MKSQFHESVEDGCAAIGAEDALQARLARKVLPRINEEGYVEYGVTITNDSIGGNVTKGSKRGKKNRQRAVGPDVDWVLRGGGGLSRGTANFFSNSLSVGRGQGGLGSTLSLRSIR